MPFQIVGQRLPRRDAILQVTGRAVYGEDLYRSGMLYARARYSDHAHATIKAIDTSKALKVDGVVDIITAKDVPHNRFGFTHADMPVLADDKVRYRGDALAVVAASSLKAAQKAVEKIKVVYEVLPAVFDPLEAMQPDAPRIHSDSNIASHIVISDGDLEAGFKESDLIIAEEYKTQKVEHCHLEPHAALAEVEPDGKIVVWSTTSRPFSYATHLSKVLALPMTGFQIKTPAVGGGFGGKNRICLEPWVALLATRTGRPVKMVYTREEEFFASTVRHSYIMRYKTGVTREGKILARQVEIISDCGAYVDQGETTLKKAAVHAAGPYQIPAVRIDAYLVYTNNVVGGAMRGFGVPQVCFACESHTDSIAHKLGLDPYEFRLQNIFRDKGRLPTKQEIVSAPLQKTLERARELSGL